VLSLVLVLWGCGTDGSVPSATDETGTLTLGTTGAFAPAIPPSGWRGRITGGDIDLTLEGSTPTLTSPSLPVGRYAVSLAGVAAEGVIVFGEEPDVTVTPGTRTTVVMELGSYIPQPMEPAAPLLAGSPVTIRWNPVPGASGGYDVEIGPDPSFNSSVDRSSTPDPVFSTVFSTPGTYFLRVRGRPNARVSIPGAWSAMTSATRLEVQSPPVVELSSARVILEAVAGTDSSPPEAVVEIRNGGGGILGLLDVTVEHPPGEPSGWLEVATHGGGATPASLVLRARPGGLAPGLYRAKVQVEAGGASGSRAVLAVEFMISGRPTVASIGVDPESLEFVAGGGGEAPPPQVVRITNTGSGILEGLSARVIYEEGGAAGWLASSLDRTQAPAILSLTASPAASPEGVHRAVVAISAEGADNSPRLIPVTLAVAGAAAPPSIDLSTSSVAFSLLAGGDAPRPQLVRIRNGGGGILSGLTISVEYGPGEPTGWLNAGLNTTTALATLTLTTAPSGLPLGDYTARVRVDSEVAEVPRTLTVTLSVAPVPMATLTVFRREAGGTGNVGLGPGDTLLFRGAGADSAQRILPVGAEVTVMVLDSIGWRATLTTEETPLCQALTLCTVRLDADLRIRAEGIFRDDAVMWELRGAGRVRPPQERDRLPEYGRWTGSGPSFRSFQSFLPVNSTARAEAEPDPGWRFHRWDGACTHQDLVCEFVVRPNGTYVTEALFEPLPGSSWPRFDGPRRFEFTVQEGSTSEAGQTQTFNGSNLSIHPVALWQDTGGDWASVELVETDGSGVVRVSVDPTGLAAGTYRRTVTFVSWKAEDRSMQVEVVLRVIP